MNIRHRPVFHLVAFAATLAIAALCVETRFPGKTSASSTPDLSTRTATNTETVEETVTLSASDVKTWSHGYEWYPKLPYCGPPFHMFPPLDDVPGSTIAGYEHYYDKGAKVFGCPDGAQVVFRGTAWFDLKDIVSKAPPLHVFVKSAALHFKKDRDCDGEELLIAQKDWLKGYADGDLVPGETFTKLPSCGSGDCVVDVATVVNNWVRGEEHGGYANYGFVFKGQREEDAHWGDNDVCLVRYSDMSLTVTYKYDKTPPVIYVRAPERPIIMVDPAILDTRKNVALAANGGVASASSELDANRTAAAAINGDRWGLHWGSDPATGSGWHDATKGVYPDWLQVQFNSEKTINEIDVFTVQDNVTAPSEPRLDMGFTQYGITNFEVQYWNSSAWTPIPSSLRSDNKLVWNKITFPSIKTTKIRVFVTGSLQDYSRIVELEAWGN